MARATTKRATEKKPAANKVTRKPTTATKPKSTRSVSDKKPARRTAATKKKPATRMASRPAPVAPSEDIDHFLKGDGLDSEREKTIGQHIGYRYDVNLLPNYGRLTPFLKKYIEMMGWDDLNWLEDVHMGYEEGRPAVFDRNINGWVTVPKDIKLPDNQQDRDMIARELLIKFQMSPKHPLFELKKAYGKF